MGKGAKKNTPKDNKCAVHRILPDPPITRSQAALLKIFMEYANNPSQLRDPVLRKAVEDGILRTPIKVITRRQMKPRGFQDEDDMEERVKKLKFNLSKDDSPTSISNGVAPRCPKSPTLLRRRRHSNCRQDGNETLKSRKIRNHRSVKSPQIRNQSARRKKCDSKSSRKNLKDFSVLIRGMEPRDPREVCFLTEDDTTYDTRNSFEERLQLQTVGDGIGNTVTYDQEETISDSYKLEPQATVRWADSEVHHHSRNELNVTNWIDNAVASVSSYFSKMKF